MTTYADITWADPNPLKRWVQRRRLADALGCVPASLAVERVIDFGAGDGALAALAAARWPQATVTCFEPAEGLAQQAEDRLAGLPRVRVERTEAGLETGADVIFCTEVFEHLPPAETARALDEIERLLIPGGLLVVGAPVEVGPPALAKGLFRMLRRRGDFDGDPGRIWRAALGRPPQDRPKADWATSGGETRGYHPHHLGFDYRALRRTLAARFIEVRLVGSPLGLLPVFLNSEAYMTATRRAP